MSTQRESRRSVNPILHIWASKLSFFILFLKLKWVGFISHFMVLYFRNVDLDLPKISELFLTPVLSRYGDENLTSCREESSCASVTNKFHSGKLCSAPPTKFFPYAVENSFTLRSQYHIYKCTTIQVRQLGQVIW